jgi:predicted amino acid racemase
MSSPYLTIDLDKIAHNARTIVDLCTQHGIAVTGVTKGACGHPDVARAMLRGGVASIGESHATHIRRLRAAGVRASYMLLRLPALSEVDDVVEVADVSLNSELTVLAGLSQAAERQGRVHDVIVMVELGDLREGVLPGDLVAFVRQALRLRGVHVSGIGTNLACFGAVAPSPENMARLVELARQTEQTLGITLACVSGANSSGLELIASGRMPPRVNHARIGEAILLGRETMHRRPWPGTFQDAFRLHAEVLELRRKPSVPVGDRCEDAFGRHPAFDDRGQVLHALLDIGREDVDIEALIPVERGVAVLGGSSDYLVADVTQAAGHVHVGDQIAFTPRYAALLAAMTSEHVEKRPVHSGCAPPDAAIESKMR